MPSINSISCWDEGKGQICATSMRVTEGDTIKSVTVRLAHIPKSSQLNLGTQISTGTGRTVRCAIWTDANLSVYELQYPTCISTTEVNTDNIRAVSSINSSPFFHEFTFEFNYGQGYTVHGVNSILIGLYSTEEECNRSSLCFERDIASPLYYINATPGAAIFDAGGPVVDVEIQSEQWNNKPPIEISQIEYRTLSKIRHKKDSEVTSSNKRRSYPEPTLDSAPILTPAKQWNAPFDFEEGSLRDVSLLQSYITPTSNVSAVTPLWVHSRSRIRITIPPLPDSFENNGIMINSTITYKVQQGNKRTNTYDEEWHKMPDGKYLPNTLIICPKDEGIGDNEPMDVVITRKIPSRRGHTQQQSDQIHLRFYTYAEPEVHIAFPKPIDSYDSRNNTITKSNYAMWATEILNDSFSESREDIPQICSTLNLLLTKDGGDNSGLPIFTRVYIAEFAGTYASNGTFPVPRNDKIISGEATPTAYWTGIQPDDGMMVQLSGLKPDGYTWHHLTYTAGRAYLSKNIELRSDDWEEVSATGVTVSRDDSGAMAGRYYVTLKDEGNHRDVVKHLDKQLCPHLVPVKSGEGEDETITYSIDRRMYFRAGYKYYIRVRRFHSAVAGILGCKDDAREINSCSSRYNFYHSRGGHYGYIGTGRDNQDVADSYVGARAGVGGNKLIYSPDTFQGYPVDDSSSWIEANNKLFAEGAGPVELLRTSSSQPRTFERHVWVGPDDGTSGLTADDARVDEVYPGFSKAEYVIIDCVQPNTSTQNLISPRPAVQEVGADHWLTFAYRHLSKGASGVDMYAYDHPDAGGTSVNHIPVMTSREFLNLDGSLPSNAWTSRNRKFPAFGKTWQGIDNTMTRMGYMYQHMIEYIYNYFKALKLPCGCNGVECDHDGEVTPYKFELTINIPKNYEDGGVITLVNAKYDTAAGITELSQDMYNTDTFMWDFFKYYKDPANSYMMRHHTNEHGQVIIDVPYTPDRFVFTHIDENKIKYGNSYKWFPVINNFDVKQDKPIKTATPVAHICNANHIPHNASGTKKILWEDDVDKLHALLATNTYHQQDGAGGTVESEWSAVIQTNETEQSSVCIIPDRILEYNENNGNLFSSPWAISSPQVIDVYSDQVYALDKGGYQQFTNNHNMLKPPQVTEQNKVYSSQHLPGKLFKRISPMSDCENGVITSGRRALPTRLDVMDPLVRTSHFLWFKSHINFGISGKITMHWDRHENKTVNRGTEEEPNYVTICAGSVGENILTDAQLRDIRTPEERENNPISLADVNLATILEQIGFHLNFETTQPDGSIQKRFAYNIVEVYGEDNGGLGRCLSADDFSAFYFDPKGVLHNVNSNGDNIEANGQKLYLDGAVEIPLKVRYTPLAAPIITRDPGILGYAYPNRRLDQFETTRFKGAPGPVTTRSSNIISLRGSKREYLSADIQEDMKDKSEFWIQLSYGMYKSAMGGNYITYNQSYPNTGTPNVYNHLQPITDHNLPAKEADSTSAVGRNTVKHGAGIPYSNWRKFNTDTYPSVGICNAFMVLLVPNGVVSNYANLPANFYADRTNFEEVWKLDSGTYAGTVIVADMAKTEVYKYMCMEDYFDENGIHITQSVDAIESARLDHNLRTLFNCKFEYHNLLQKLNGSVITSLSSSEIKNRKNLLKIRTWYDLVVVPIFTNEDGFGSDETVSYGFKSSTGSSVYIPPKFNGNEYDFKYVNGSGVVGPAGEQYGGSASEHVRPIRFYGSNPLVVRKFLYIANNSSGGGGGGGTPPPPPPPEVKPRPFAAEGCILFPNVNNRLYNVEAGLIKECPGFWLNNTFRVVCRAPHFRDKATIDRQLGSYESTYETDLEQASNGMLGGSAQCKEFIFSDCMLHFAKYNDTVKRRSYDANGNFVGFVDDVYSYIDDDGIEHNNVKYKFNDAEFQKLITQHATDRQWLNDRNIYSMRTNGNAFSKRVPMDFDKDDSLPVTDTRDVIRAGSFTTEGDHYSDRVFEFNPSLVDVQTPYPEGYYIQVSFLNAEYAPSSEQGEWTEWFGGVLGGGILDKDRKTDSPDDLAYKDFDLEYFVPTRDYHQLFTEFRHYIKESTPGSNLISTSAKVGDNPYRLTSDGASIIERLVKGAGSESPNTQALSNEPRPNPTYVAGFGNYHDTLIDSDPDDVDVEGYSKGLETAIVPEVSLPRSGTAEGDGNNDYPYPPQLWTLNSNGTYDDSDRYKIPEEVEDRHQTYWEMNYVDYLIRNMAKLYQSDWSEALVNDIDIKVTPEDVGWTRAKAHAYRKWKLWGNDVYDVDTSHMNISIQNSEVAPSDDPDTPPVVDYKPYNVNRYFRKTITAQDFESLLNVLKHMTAFLRDEKLTGTQNDNIDPKEPVTYYGAGTSVLPIAPELLNFNSLYATEDSQPLTQRRRGIIGHSIFPNSGTSDMIDNERIDCNFIQNLMSVLTQKVIRPGISLDVDYN